MPTIKISVIVPTYRPGERLSLVVNSLDAQTMPASEFEVIFVDDGSADGTIDLLHEIAAARPNVSVIEIENSGWGSRPRNVGIDSAVGRYVTFMDHDDSLFPNALQSAYDAGAAIAADFVNPKEVVDRGWSWGWDVWSKDRALKDRSAMHPRDVTPLMPHKLYRREFLLEHGIRFPEGRRAFFEDFYFNTEVFAKASAISILASEPFYTWHRNTGDNSSNALYDSVEVYWTKLAEVARFMTTTVAEPEALRWLLINHYRWWVVDLFGPRMLKRDAEFLTASMGPLAAAFATWIPDDADRELEPAQRATAHLMRAGDLDSLIELAHVDRGTTAIADTVDIEWTSEGLRVVVTATWVDADGQPMLLERREEGLYRTLGEGLDNVLPPQLRHVSEAVAAAWGWLTVRSRSSRVSWRVPTTSTVHVDEVGGKASVRVVAEGVIDPATMVFGRPLGDDVWDIGARFSMIGHQVHSGVRYEGKVRGSVADGRSAVVHRNGRGALALDLGEVSKSVFSPSRIDGAGARAIRSGGVRRRRITLPLKSVQLVHDRVPAIVRFDGGRPVRAHLERTDTAVELVVDVALSSGTHRWTAQVGAGKEWELPAFSVDFAGRIRFQS